MKWYSINKYRPPAEGFCLVRTEWGTFYSAEYRNGNEDSNANYSHGWMMATLCEEFGAPVHIELFGITHFCIPEPVEIENEN